MSNSEEPPQSGLVEHADLLNFFIEKSKEATVPFNVTQLGREFKEKHKLDVSESAFRNKCKTFRGKLENIDVDREMKVKLMFLLSAPMEKNFLQSLQNDSTVEIEVDDLNRITKYKKEGDLVLEGQHATKGGQNRAEIDKEILKFLAEKSKEGVPITDVVFVSEFKKSSNFSDSESSLHHRYSALKSHIISVNEFDMETRVKMLFVSGTKITDAELFELQKKADVGIDANGKIVNYRSYDNKLELKKVLKNKKPRNSKENESGAESEGEKNGSNEVLQRNKPLLTFLAKKSMTAVSPLCLTKLGRAYIEETESQLKLHTLTSKIAKLRFKIPDIQYFDKETKVRMLFALLAPISVDYLDDLREAGATVETDDKNRITKYDDGTLILQNYHHLKELNNEEENDDDGVFEDRTKKIIKRRYERDDEFHYHFYSKKEKHDETGLEITKPKSSGLPNLLVNMDEFKGLTFDQLNEELTRMEENGKIATFNPNCALAELLMMGEKRVGVRQNRPIEDVIEVDPHDPIEGTSTRAF